MRKFKAGQKVWLVPIRYWERADVPHECSVLADYVETDHDTSFNLYVHHNDYGHPVYVEVDKAYFSREAAIKAGKLLAAQMELKDDDYFNSWSETLWEKTTEGRSTV